MTGPAERSVGVSAVAPVITNGLIGLYPGSFDPPHVGHLDVIARAAACCSRLVVAVSSHPDKHACLAADTRVALLRACRDTLPANMAARIDVVIAHGATRDVAQIHGAAVIIRGVRSATDLESEAPMAQVHREHGLETLVLICRPEHSLISSRMVRHVLAAGLPVGAYVPPPVAAALAKLQS